MCGACAAFNVKKDIEFVCVCVCLYRCVCVCVCESESVYICQSAVWGPQPFLWTSCVFKSQGNMRGGGGCGGHMSELVDDVSCSFT